MAAPQLNKSRTIKKLEKPRPLKLVQQQRHSTVDGRITTVQGIVSLIDNVASQLTNGSHDRSLQTNVVTMCNHLKLYAHHLEPLFKGQLDRAFVAIRNGSQDERLDLTTRVHLLELVELRAKQWRHNDSMDDYYSQKLCNLDQSESLIFDTTINSPSGSSLISPTWAPTWGENDSSTPLLGPGEVIKSNGKFPKPTRIPGKNCCKQEVIIRNSDSGKVNPGAKERLVQITGTSKDKINYAKDLIEDTIKRNASPVRLEQSGGGDDTGIGGSSSSLNSSASDDSNRLQQQQHHKRSRPSLLHSFSTNDASIGEYKYTVTVGNQSLKITGCNLDLVRIAKLVLDEYFLGDSENGTGIEYFSVEEDPSFPVFTPNTTETPSTSNNHSLDGIPNFDIASTPKHEEIRKPSVNADSKSIIQKEIRELTYEFLLQCSTGPWAKRAPADWARIQEECPNIVRKVAHCDSNANHLTVNANPPRRIAFVQ